MIDRTMVPESDASVESRARLLYAAEREKMQAWVDRLFAWLLLFEWAATVLIAFIVSPRTWSGDKSSFHPHVWAAIGFGGVLFLFPALLVWFRAAGTRPGSTLNQHVIAISQMLMSSLLIQVTGARIETHFHVFGSLAFLAFYRDWRVVVTASLVTAIDHSLRGIFWPYTIYGRTWASPWQSAEHIAWVVFNDIFLIWSGLRSNADMLIVAQREARSANLIHQAQHDALTGLPNRLVFASNIEQNLAEAAASGRKLALLCIDLDRFKCVNDTLGHQVGDKLLQEVSTRFSRGLTQFATLVRMGGDEFAVLVRALDNENAAQEMAARLLESLNQVIDLGGHKLHASASIGVSIYPDMAGNALELQKNADIAMYRVKSRGGNGFEFFSGRDSVAMLRGEPGISRVTSEAGV